MNNLEVKVKLNEEDIYEFQKEHFSRLVKPGLRISIIIAAALMFIANLVMDFTAGGTPSITAVFLGVILIILLGTPLMFRMSSKRGLKSNEMLKAEYTYTINTKTISSVSENTSMNSRWDMMHDFRDSKVNFIFYIANNQAFLIPKRCFANEQEIEFVKECSKAIPVRKKKINLFKISMMVSLGITIVLFIILMIITMR